ncbi:efflux RND transporter permease subunit [Marinagarivorans cellulosilyticus]|uniref:Multidrug efflux pump n=1 Tax=Marinagarivorans cellulosilyticus TaxID=2721545 RepID=A0AAN2BIR3_9GAMM|nr:efflux RND transporter permease subunit [Marinagarivorans cellulosilyticus]BCD96255.1 multidrug efflux pump [Marinagarivorans cellulosilyticus]
MIITDISVKRPVFASVISLLILAFGLVAFDRLPLREYPDIDAPVITVDTNYRGAAAAVVERRITKIIEDRISGIEGIKNIVSSSEDGRSRVSIEFNINRDIDGAANDVRDRVARVLENLPADVDPPEVSKAGADDDTIMWFNLVSDRMNLLELTDYANRYLIDRFSVLDGVARVRVGGGLDYALRIWLDRNALAARSLTVTDIEQALRRENIELPAGSVESEQRQFTVRLERAYRTPEQISEIVITKNNNYIVRLGDVARIELGAEEHRKSFRGNGVPMVGVGITKQSTANTLEVARAARALLEDVNQDLPQGTELLPSYDSSVFIEQSIKEVYQTLFIAMGLVIVVIFLFLGDVRATLIPAVTVPVSLMGTFIVLFMLGFTINLLTLLAMILAIGMVVDDAIVMLENIHRRIAEGETPLVAAFLGARQVSFAVIATTAVLISVFLPITFLEGDLGKLFTEFAIAMSAAVAFSSIIALSLSPMMCSKLLSPNHKPSRITSVVDNVLGKLRDQYQAFLNHSIKRPAITFVGLALSLGACIWLFKHVPSEFTPKEDRGAFFVMVSAPEGSSFKYSQEYMDEIEKRLMPMVDSGEVKRLLIRTPRSFGSTADYSGGFVIIVLEDWADRRSAFTIMGDVRKRLGDLAGVRAFPVMRQALGRGFGKPLQLVIGGSNYDELANWRDIMIQHASENPRLLGLDHDFKETKPQVLVNIETQRAADLGISAEEIGNTLAALQGSRRVTTYLDRGEEYDVIIEGERSQQNTPMDMANIFVRSRNTNKLIPLDSVVSINEGADANTLNRYNRMRAITLEANLADGYTLGEAITYLEDLAKQHLPAEAVISFKGQSQDLRDSGQSIYFIFALALVVVFLVLAAQFESYVHPFIIMLTVPLAIMGALIGLYVFGQSLNIYSQIGIIMLVGLAAKNGILIVEFTNQLRDQGVNFDEAIITSAGQRLRPIIMTAITTAFGALPLVLSSGAGAETRTVIGIVVLTGIIAATFFTLTIVPIMYHLLAKNTGSPKQLEMRLEKEMANTEVTK